MFAMFTTREKLALSAVLALAVACRLDKLFKTPRPLGLGVSPPRVTESADSGSGEVRSLALTVSSPSRVLTWTAHIESGSRWLALVNDSGSTPDTLRFTLNPTALPPGTHAEAIIIDPNDVGTPSVRVPVELRIDPVAPGSGDLTVNANTTGDAPDPDGYRVTVDGASGRTITSNGSTTYALGPGNYRVQLGDVAANCSVIGGASRQATVAAGQQSTVSFTVDCPGAPVTRLLFSTQPTTTTAGSAMTPSVQVTAVDGQGGTVTTFTGTVRLDILDNPGGGTLAGNVNASAVAGVATFPGLSINKAASDYTLAAHASGLTAAVSEAFAINPGAPDHLVFTVQPNNAQVNRPIAPAVQVTMLDINGNVATSFTDIVFMGIDNDGSFDPPATLSAPGTQRAAAAGVATFEDLRIDKAGAGYTLVASATRLKGGFSSAFDVTSTAPPPPPPATRLEFTQQPPDRLLVNGGFPVTVTALNDQGGVATGFTGLVQLTLQGPITVGGLVGTRQVNAVGGVARFTNLRITGVCVGCSLVASASGPAGTTSSPFTVIGLSAVP